MLSSSLHLVLLFALAIALSAVMTSAMDDGKEKDGKEFDRLVARFNMPPPGERRGEKPEERAARHAKNQQINFRPEDFGPGGSHNIEESPEEKEFRRLQRRRRNLDLKKTGNSGFEMSDFFQ
jgi:hypothetical protein